MLPRKQQASVIQLAYFNNINLSALFARLSKQIQELRMLEQTVR